MEQVEQRGAAPQRPWRVLVVDDEENLNWSLVASLRRENYSADGALTADDARRRLTEMAYDCVISDVKMPGIDGFQLLSWLREWRPSTRVIMMTAFGSPSVRQEAFRNGVIAYLEKPFDLRVLKQELRRTLETRPQQPPSYDLIDMTQAINVGRRDVVAQILAGGITGLLAFEHGDLVAAEYNDLHGDAAFQAMCVAPAQRVWQVTPATPPERNVTKPVSALIFDALLARNAPAAGSGALSLPPVPAVAPPEVRTATPAQASPTGAPVARPTGGAGQIPSPDENVPDAQRALARLVASIGAPGAAALLTSTGVVKALAQTAQPALTDEVFAHLAQAVQATARAARVGQWGPVREARLFTGQRQALVRLLNAGGEALALVVIVPASLDSRQFEAAVATHEGALRALPL